MREEIYNFKQCASSLDMHRKIHTTRLEIYAETQASALYKRPATKKTRLQKKNPETLTPKPSTPKLELRPPTTTTSKKLRSTEVDLNLRESYSAGTVTH